MDKFMPKTIEDLNAEFEARMEKAKQLLRYSDQRSYEIALAVGYDNPNYFSTLFKKNTDFSPTEYRQKQKENGAAKQKKS